MKQFFDAVIFDMDGLLLDSESIAFAAFREACEKFKLGDQSNTFRRCIGTNQEAGEKVIRESFRAMVDPMKFIAIWDEIYVQNLTNKAIPLKSGVIELLEHLTLIDIPLAVATSSNTPRATQKLTDAGIQHFFKFVVGGEQVVKSKPNPDIYLKAASLLKAEPRKCLALEDSENGVRAGVSAGMVTVQIPDLVEPSNELRALGHIILSNIREVITFEFGSISPAAN